MVGSVPFAVTERAEGTSLESLVRERQQLSAEETLRIALHVARALGALHRAGYVHQRLSPAAIFIAHDPLRVKVTGLTKPIVTAEESGELSLATLPFIAPEQAVGEVVDERTDVYALGVVMHFMLTGKPPVRGGGSRSTLARVAVTTAPAPSWYEPSVPEALDYIVASATRKHQESRYQSVREMAVDLRRALSGETVTGVERLAFPDRLVPRSDLGQHLFAKYQQELR
jgi:serine/threonine-protein kinase